MIRTIFLSVLLFTAATLNAESRNDSKDIWGSIPLRFEPNYGQTDPDVKFLSRAAGYGLFFTDHEAFVVLATPETTVAPPGTTTVRMKVVGQSSNAKLEPVDALPGVSHYFVGSQDEWRGDVPHFGKIRYQAVYEGIDLLFYGNQRQLEYDFVVAPGADPLQIALEFTGADAIRLNDQGDLVLETKAGKLFHQRPVAFQEKDGSIVSVPADFVMSDGRVRFSVGEYDRSLPLIIDPTLVYSTYLGGTATGNAGDQGNAIAVDALGNTYITGFTTSTDFMTGLATGPRGAGLEAFVLRMSENGALLSASYLGGAGVDEGLDLALDATGNIYITGYTSSPDFPIVGGVQRTSGGLQDAFLIKFNNSASTILYSTYVGGSGDERAYGLALDPGGNIYISGPTGSRNFPVSNAFQSSYGGGLSDVFIVKFNPAGAIVYSTYLGGVGHDQSYDIAVSADANVHVVGYTTSINFPVANAIVPQYRGGSDDAFVVKLNTEGNALVFSTYMGGSGSDNGVRITVDGEGFIYFTGYTSSADFPITENALQGGLIAEFDAFLTKFSPDGQAVPFSTYIGSDGTESGVGLALDPAGNIYLAGFTSSFQFYTVNPLQRLLNNGAAVLTRDAFVMKFTPDMKILYSTYIGGSENEGAVGLAVDGVGNAYITGYTTSDNFFIANAFQTTRSGGQDAFLSKINAEDIKTNTGFQVTAPGGVAFLTDAGTVNPIFGYATADVAPGVAPPTGLSMIGLNQIGQLVSEVAAPLGPFVQNGRMFVHLAGNAINTVLTIMNPNDEEVTVTFFYTSEIGEQSNFGTATIPAKGHFSRFLTDTPYEILTDTVGTLTFNTSLPVAVAGFRTYSNEVGNFILSRTPIFDPYLGITNQPTTIPIIADSAGWSSHIILVNTTEEVMSGEVRFYGPANSTDGGPIDITSGDVVNGSVTQSVYPYQIQPRTVFRIITGGAEESIVTGFAEIVPSVGTNTPSAYAILSFTENGATSVQAAVEAQLPQRSVRLLAETVGNVAEFEPLSIRTALSLANPFDSPVTVRLELFNLSGSSTGVSTQVTIPARGQLSRFLDEIPGLDGISSPYHGPLHVTVISGSGIAATTMRTRVKEFGGFLATTTGPIPDTSSFGQTVVFPHIAEGGGYTTDFILLSNVNTPGSSGSLSFVDSEGQVLHLSVIEGR